MPLFVCRCAVPVFVVQLETVAGCFASSVWLLFVRWSSDVSFLQKEGCRDEEYLLELWAGGPAFGKTTD